MARVRDVNDRVSAALLRRDLKAAVEMAKADKNSLRQYEYRELLKAYLEDLLETSAELELSRSNDIKLVGAGSSSAELDLAALAATECARLVGIDAELWENWIYVFMDYKQVAGSPPPPHLSPRYAML